MGIYEQQKQALTQGIYIDILRHGLQPLAMRIQDLLRRAQGRRRLGTSFFKYTDLRNNYCSDPVIWNKDLQDIAFDLDIIFKEIQEQAQKIMSLSVYYKHERDKLARKIRALDNRCDILEKQLDNPGYLGFADSYIDFSMIESAGNTSLGLPKTTALVDLKRGVVRLSRPPGTNAKYDLKDAHIQVSLNPEGITYGKIEHILIDSINDTWQAVITAARNALVKVSAKLTEPVLINCVELEFENSNDTKVELSIGNDITTIGYGDFMAWEFEPRKIDKLDIIITKTVPDDGQMFVFVIKQLALKYEKFLNQGTVITKTIPVSAMNEIKLMAEEVIPSQTDIRYYVSPEYENKPFSWQEISSGVPAQLNNILRNSGLLDRLNPGFGVVDNMTSGVIFYGIGIIDHLPAKGSMQLYMGEKMWLIEDIDIPEINPEELLLFKPNQSHWVGQLSRTKQVVDISRHVVTLNSPGLYRLTTFVYRTNQIAVNNISSRANDQLPILYVNSSPIIPVSGVFSFTLQEGWNKLQYLLLVTEPTIFRHGLALDMISQKIYANNKSLQEVAIHDLINNISPGDHNKYALVPKDNGYLVVINYNPIERDYYKQGCRYYYDYSYIEDIPGLKGIRMMAVLSRTALAKEVTPCLKGYKLLVR